LGEQSGDDRPGCRFSATFGLQLDIGVQAEFGEKRNGLRQRRDPLPRKGSIEPAPGIAITHRCQREDARLAASVGRARESIVMEKNRFIIAGEANIELDPIATESFCPAQGAERVLGRTARGAAMADYPREEFFKAGDFRRDLRSGYQVAAFTCCSWRSGRREPRSSPVS
jgi:hypothetical protein